MNRDEFRESLLQVMEAKVHWAWPSFGDGTVQKDRLHYHFEQEYEVYVRDFPVLIGRAFIQCPVAVVRQELAENLYEEETGGLSGGRPHPELFLLYPEGLGFDLDRFKTVELGERASAYRGFLDDATTNHDWDVAAAVTTLFLEGSPHERGELDENAEKRPAPPLSEHPLVKHYGLPLDCLELTRTHRKVEGGHREAAWRVMLDHVDEKRREVVIEKMKGALEKWLAYRDEVAECCGLARVAG